MRPAVQSNPPLAEPVVPPSTYPLAYELADLGETEDGQPLLPVALNDAGMLALNAHPPEREARAGWVRGFVSSGGRGREERHAVLGGPPLAGLNRAGILCGQERAVAGPLRAWASHLDGFGAIHWPEAPSTAAAVNTCGEVAGDVTFEAEGRTRRRVFVVNAQNEAIFLPAPNGASATAVALNDACEVLVNAMTGPHDLHSRALVWTRGGFQPIEGLDGGGTWGAAISPLGRVAGRLFNTLGGIRAFLWEKGRTLELSRGVDGHSEAFGVNDQRVVVGRIMDVKGVRLAFRWTPADGLRPLRDLVRGARDWELHKATGVNARGEIIGTGQRQGALRGFLLRPVG